MQPPASFVAAFPGVHLQPLAAASQQTFADAPPPPALLNQVFTWSWEEPQAGLGEDRDPLGLGDPQSLRLSLTRSTVGETRHQLSGLNEKDATFASEFRCTVLPSDPPQTITADGWTDGRTGASVAPA